ncbi:MAG TPA: CPBP family intramembrane glutamic endopeptidase [Actinomycetota bacterium]|nr:CPBP family intramembrane glutamic endopeptidase [Actinomycetota bacterium]
MRGFARRHPLGVFLAVTYTWSWSFWIADAIAGGHVSHFPGLLGPMVGALATSGLTGTAGDLWRRMTRWRVPARWYGLAAIPLIPATVAYLVWWLLPIDGPNWSRIAHLPGAPALGGIGTLVILLLVNGYGEETGWRGFAVPHLRERHGPLAASLLLAIPWALWHLPTLWLDTGMRGFEPFMLPAFLLSLAAGSIVLTWLAEGSGSILIVALWHTALNLGSATDAAAGGVAVLTSVVVIVWAVRVIRGWRGNPRPAQPAMPLAAAHLR